MTIQERMVARSEREKDLLKYGRSQERERIIKLLKELGDGCDCDECGSNNDLGHYWFEVELIKGEK